MPRKASDKKQQSSHQSVAIIETDYDKQLTLMQNQLLVLKEISQGTPIETIAERLKMPIAEVQRLAEGGLEIFQERIAKKVGEIKTRDFIATQIALDMVMEGVLKGDPDALKALVPLLKRRADMLGYDANRQVEVKSSEGAVLAVIGMSMDEI